MTKDFLVLWLNKYPCLNNFFSVITNRCYLCFSETAFKWDFFFPHLVPNLPYLFYSVTLLWVLVLEQPSWNFLWLFVYHLTLVHDLPKLNFFMLQIYTICRDVYIDWTLVLSSLLPLCSRSGSDISVLIMSRWTAMSNGQIIPCTDLRKLTGT